MRKALVAPFVMAIGLASMAPGASADPAKASSASAYGARVQLGGSDLVGPLPTVTASQPPDQTVQRQAVLPLDVNPLALNGTVVARADATQADAIAPILNAQRLAGNEANSKATPFASNARGFGSAENVGVVVSANPTLPPGLPQLPEQLLPSLALVKADAVESESVAKCVNNQPVFDFGYNVVGLALGGQQLTAINSLVTGVLDILGPTNPLAGIVTVSTPHNDPTTVVKTADGIAVDALRVNVLGGTGGTPLISIVIGHSEAHMSANCAVAPPTSPPASILATTGGNGMTSEIGATLLLVAALGLVIRRGQLAAARRRS